MTSPKRRSCNFTLEELNILVQLVEVNKVLLLSGDTKAGVNQRKKEKWEEIGSGITAACHVANRNGHDTKLRWQQLCTKGRAEMDAIQKTCGGSPPPPLSALSADVWDIIRTPASEGLTGVDSSRLSATH